MRLAGVLPCSCPALLLPAILMSAAPMTPAERERALASLRSVQDAAPLDWARLDDLLAERAHLPHKEWASTEASATVLSSIVGGPDDLTFRRLFQRVLEDGNWNGAASAAAKLPASSKPWAVLVTGLNGIRKTTSIYQPWFKELLATALGDTYVGAADELPDGSNSFFRQLDFMIATLALEEFKALYTIEDVTSYAQRKEAIFSRYRTYAEVLGALLVKEARTKRLNVMVETSGRDIAMFRYVDHFFPEEEYRKLVVHFTINDIQFAERSVDSRMLNESENAIFTTSKLL